MALPLGIGVPPNTPHAISVSLPTWSDNVAYEEGDDRVLSAMVSGYPRFFIHLSIRRLASICQHKYALHSEHCFLFPARSIAEQCRDFIRHRSSHPVQPRLIDLFVPPSPPLHIVVVPVDQFKLAKQFWQHTGLGISSRQAEKSLALLPDDGSAPRPNKHYAVKSVTSSSPDLISSDHATYLEERYGRNLPLSAASSAKRALRRRIARTLLHDGDQPGAGVDGPDLTGPSSRGVNSVTEDDVYLYPCGMAAIWSAHKLLRDTRPEAKSVCFGFPYVDTLKILQKWGPGVHFFGSGLDADIDSLAALLSEIKESSTTTTTTTPPVLALFTEFPSNPLLRSADLPRLRALADEYDFLLVIDETVGNFVNVDVLPFADIVVSSLTKVFSGASNVMGGSLVLNPNSRHYASLKESLSRTYVDTYFSEDAIYMERNSRDFQRRIEVIDRNTEAICDFLRSRSVAGGYSPKDDRLGGVAIKEVYYPKYITRENYDRCRPSSSSSTASHGFGGLFSLSFTSLLASSTFFDALPCYKGPSLGTNFTLACPYTIIAHYEELGWAEEWGVERALVRVSVGLDLEREGAMVQGFVKALELAESVVGGEMQLKEKNVA